MRSDRTLLGSSRTRLVAASLVAGLLAIASGCGGTGEVSGKITYKNKAVVHGFVGFVGPDGTSRSARINPDGTYTVKDVRAGEAKITVVSENPSAVVPGGRGRDDADYPKDAPKRDVVRDEKPEAVDPEVIKKWFPIPADYGDVTKTKLRFKVKAGSNTHDIQLD